jgi:Ala-tRNA(Pro) deacylase
MTGHERLAEYLQEQGVEFSTRVHPEAFTAQEVAAAEHVPGHRFVKVVMVKAGDSLAMLCLPAPYDVDFEAAATALHVDETRLATEEEFSPLFPDCEIGAMPPFGNLYDIPVYIDDSLEEDERIVFNACNHRETVEMSFEDFRRIVHPTAAQFSRPH